MKPVVAEIEHHCRVELHHRGRITGWAVICEVCGIAPRIARTRPQANRLAREHSEKYRLGMGQ